MLKSVIHTVAVLASITAAAVATTPVFAQPDRFDGRDWDGPNRGDDGQWDRGAMRGYGWRATRQGMTMTMGESVLFRTASAELRPGAMERLRPLARFLRANPGVRIAIDGYTDARGGDAYNQDLSERRAAAVRGVFDTLGVFRARFRVVGHGEDDPVASNATDQGMRLNRRVEVTLIGWRNRF